MAAISESEARTRLEEVPGWDVGDKSLVRKLSWRSFPEAIAFVVKVAFVAEGADHHRTVRIVAMTTAQPGRSWCRPAVGFPPAALPPGGVSAKEA